MAISEQKLEEVDELKWISKGGQSFSNKLKSKGIFGILVPLGCLVTTGVLMSGIYNMFQRNSKKQQLLMRYRVFAQGITVALAAIGILQFRSS